MTTPTKTVTAEVFISKPPPRVWAALTSGEELAKWWAPGDIRPVVGHTFLMQMGQWGQVACEVSEVEDGRRLVYTFGDWTLSWDLEAEGPGTRLRLEHSGFDLTRPRDQFAFEHMGPGWSHMVLPRLERLLAGEG